MRGYCGDYMCGFDEDCHSCSIDCGSCGNVCEPNPCDPGMMCVDEGGYPMCYY